MPPDRPPVPGSSIARRDNSERTILRDGGHYKEARAEDEGENEAQDGRGAAPNHVLNVQRSCKDKRGCGRYDANNCFLHFGHLRVSLRQRIWGSDFQPGIFSAPMSVKTFSASVSLMRKITAGLSNLSPFKYVSEKLR